MVGDYYVLGSGVVQVEIFNTVPDEIRVDETVIASKLLSTPCCLGRSYLVRKFQG